MKFLRYILTISVIIGVGMPAPCMFAMQQEPGVLIRLDNVILSNKPHRVIDMATRIFEYESDAVQKKACKKIQDYLPKVSDDGQRKTLQGFIKPQVAIDQEHKKSVDEAKKEQLATSKENLINQVGALGAVLQPALASSPAHSLGRERRPSVEPAPLQQPAEALIDQDQVSPDLPAQISAADAKNLAYLQRIYTRPADQEVIKAEIAKRQQSAPRNSWNKNVAFAGIFAVVVAIGAYFWFSKKS